MSQNIFFIRIQTDFQPVRSPRNSDLSYRDLGYHAAESKRTFRIYKFSWTPMETDSKRRS